ncbi:NUDIX hydrolase [Marinagarivorans algicola]|uniref:NUDIX hydrolase n=1 Tax=Marinagarivorans algicola TaxID=1513270 RepID=UPI000B202507|nr:CoA pyrophosphatase [Marinagarivorans algicola]
MSKEGYTSQDDIVISTYNGEAAVLLAVREHGGEQQILLTRRSKRMNSHSGEVALPGGKWEPSDQNLRATALREAEEEVGLSPQIVTDIKPMAARFTRQGTKVTPFFGRVPPILSLQPCEYELESLFWLPLDIVLNDERVQTDIFTVDRLEYWAPVYRYNGYKIWGFTARLLVDLANRFFCSGASSKIVRQSLAYAKPEVIF